jgi:Xaa-Pro aminopeptidase
MYAQNLIKVNIATVEAIRAIQKNVVLEMSEQTIGETLNHILVRAGLEPYFNLVLFGSDAANPHGGVDESRQLEQCEFILIDVGTSSADKVDAGAVFHGYSSDITRTFLPSRTDIEDCPVSYGNRTLQELWSVVYDAQSAAIASLNPNHTCADVDLAAREVIENAGLGKYFTHRLGHGLGIEGHERPYLNKGNTHIKLRAGNVFTAEPGMHNNFGCGLQQVFT